MVKDIFTIVGGTTFDDRKVNITVTDGSISHIGSEVHGREIAATGKHILPGLVDLHTHLREPGKEDSETVESGSRAAVKGGYTAISAMPNTNPVADTAGVVE